MTGGRETGRRRPSVLLVQADQFRWDCLGAAGHPDVSTPHLDQLAADGVRYTEAFCPLPVCTPSRYSLLTGLYPHQHGGWTNHCTLPPATWTFPRALRQAGYRTAAVGKMHFTPAYLDVGYARMTLAEQHGPGRWEDDYHRELREAGLAPVADLTDQEEWARASAPAAYWRDFGAGRSDLPEEWHSTTWIAERALAELERWDEAGGNLLHVSFIKPHHPFDPPAPWDERYDPAALTVLPGWTDAIPPADLPHQRHAYFPYETLTEAALRRVMAGYYATITQLDHHVGRMLRLLRERGLYQDTLVVFTSDHGEYLGFHHLLLKNGPMYDPLVRVPLLVKYPAGRGPGTGPSGDLVSLTDVAPTIASVCGVQSPAWLPGLDLTGPGPARDVVFAENRTFGRHELMARSRTHKLLLYGDVPADGSGHEAPDALFDLVADPHELDNRLADPAGAEAAARLRSALARWAMFDTPVPTYLDEEAPRVDAPNVPPPVPARRAAHRAYFQAAVARSVAATAVQRREPEEPPA